MKNALNLEFKDAADENDPAALLAKATADFQAMIDNRLKPIETKSADDAKFKDRLDKIEAKMNRPGGDLKADNDNAAKLETKAFTSYMRRGDGSDELTLKTLRVSSDPQGGYF